jgi:hypothetical protein
MYHDYLNYLLILEEKTAKMESTWQTSEGDRHDNEPRNCSHNFTVIYDVKPKMNSTKYAVFWGYYMLDYPWGHDDETMGEEYLKANNCPETDCVFTNKIDLLPNIYDYDALIFNAFNANFSFPTLRSPHQLYIMTANE